MIIAKIETFPLRIPFKPGTGAAASARGDKGLPAADSLLVKVTIDKGLEGWGETFGFRAVPSAKLAIEELIAPPCIGRDATQIGPLMLEVQKKLHIFGRTGPLFYGISAVDIALWDICGKAAGLLVCKLLGRNSAADLTCYASLIRYSDSSLVRANVRRALDSGFRVLPPRSVFRCFFLAAPVHATAALGSVDAMVEWRYFVDARGFRMAAGENASTLMDLLFVLPAASMGSSHRVSARLQGRPPLAQH